MRTPNRNESQLVIQSHLKTLSIKDASQVWRINEEGLPWVGKVSEAEIEGLLERSSFALGAFNGDLLQGFVICLPPKTTYSSLNYRWFNERYEDFLYVDRIAISAQHRGQGIGAQIYSAVVEAAQDKSVPVLAEVMKKPLNEPSMHFHSAFSFVEVGTLIHEKYTVSMLFRSA